MHALGSHLDVNGLEAGPEEEVVAVEVAQHRELVLPPSEANTQGWPRPHTTPCQHDETTSIRLADRHHTMSQRCRIWTLAFAYLVPHPAVPVGAELAVPEHLLSTPQHALRSVSRDGPSTALFHPYPYYARASLSLAYRTVDSASSITWMVKKAGQTFTRTSSSRALLTTTDKMSGCHSDDEALTARMIERKASLVVRVCVERPVLSKP